MAEHGIKWCPKCGKLMRTSVMPNLPDNGNEHGLHYKRRIIICGSDAAGTGGCGTQWKTLDILQDELEALICRKFATADENASSCTGDESSLASTEDATPGRVS